MSTWEYFIALLNSWGILIVSSLGLLGNALCALVVLHRDMWSPVAVLIIGLALSDSLLLLSENLVLVTALAGVYGYIEDVWWGVEGLILFSMACSVFFIVGI